MSMTRAVDLTTLLDGAEPAPGEPVIRSRAHDVDRLIALKRECDKVEDDFRKIRRELEMAASDLRNKLEEQGKFTAVVTLQGTAETLTMSYTDQMKTVDEDEGPVIERSIGRRAFSKLFELAKGWVLRPGSDLKLLRKLIRAAGGDPDEFIVEAACYKPQDGFRKTRFQLRPRLSDKQNTLLDLLVARLQYEPRLGGVKWVTGKVTNGNSEKA